MVFKYELGQKVRDRVTGCAGIIVARTEWLYGCLRYSLQSPEFKDGRPVELYTIDEAAAEFVDAGLIVAKAPTGGPQSDPGRSREVSR